MELIYTRDKENNEILQDKDGIHQVMMEWEKPYMEKCIELLNPYGKVLEVGFGLGYSATKICSYKDVTEYNVIECSPVVWKKFELWKQKLQTKRPELEIKIIKGRWEDMLSTLETYDTIFFDDYTYDVSIQAIERFQTFLKQCILQNHTKIGTKVSLYSTTNKYDNFKDVDCLNIKVHNFNINIPKYCKYARGDVMYIPIIKVINNNFQSVNNIIDYPSKMISLHEKQNKLNQYYNRYSSRNVKYLVIDNFIDNIDSYLQNIKISREQIKYPGLYTSNKRTLSHTSDSIKFMIQHYIYNIWGNISNWNNSSEKTNMNGSFELINCHDDTFIDTSTDEYNTYAILLLSKHSNDKTTFNICHSIDGTRYKGEMHIRENNKIFEKIKYDKTRWIEKEQIQYVFNRLILFNSDLFTTFSHNYGTDILNCNLYQIFKFSCSS